MLKETLKSPVIVCPGAPPTQTDGESGRGGWRRVIGREAVQSSGELSPGSRHKQNLWESEASPPFVLVKHHVWINFPVLDSEQVYCKSHLFLTQYPQGCEHPAQTTKCTSGIALVLATGSPPGPALTVTWWHSNMSVKSPRAFGFCTPHGAPPPKVQSLALFLSFSPLSVNFCLVFVPALFSSSHGLLQDSPPAWLYYHPFTFIHPPPHTSTTVFSYSSCLPLNDKR